MDALLTSELITAYIVLGVVGGVFAGLLGVGGGMIYVPILTEIYRHAGLPLALSLKLALGTSSAAILLNSLIAIPIHWARGTILVDVVKVFVPGVLIGALVGSALAGQLPSTIIATAFALLLLPIALNMWFNFVKMERRQLPGRTSLTLVSSIIGFFSSILAIGGGSMMLPFFRYCSITMRAAISTSTGIGLFIAIGATIGYVYSGWQATNHLAYALGYVHLATLAIFAFTSFFAARWGATLTHRINTKLLQQIFAVMLLIAALRILSLAW